MQSPLTSHGLAGCRVLVVEDEQLLAMMVERTLKIAGVVVVGPYGRLAEALAAVQQGGADVAVLDINLVGEMVFPLAEALERLAVPFLFTSGYGDDVIPPRYRLRKLLAKPFLPCELLTALAALRQGTG